MQVDLFKNSEIRSNGQRLSPQIETRKCLVEQKALKNLPREVDGVDSAVLQQFRLHIIELTEKPRQYMHIGSAGSDNLWELEMLGICKYARRYTMVLDFSDALDYILELTFGCDREAIRNIENYQNISKQLMTYNLAESEEKFGVLFNNEVMKKVYLRFMSAINNNIALTQLSQDERLAMMVYTFYKDVLEKVADLRDYIVSYILCENKGDTVFRSKTFSSAIISSSKEYDTSIVINYDGHASYTIPVRYYEMYDWISERLNK